MESLSDKQVVRLFWQICNRIHKRCSGDPYGVDLTTLRIIAPGLATAYTAVGREIQRRKLTLVR